MALVVTYADIQSRMLSMVEGYDLVELYNKDNGVKLESLMTEWVLSVKSTPKVKKLFTSLSYDKESKNLSFEMKNSPNDDDFDKDYVIELFALGIASKWVKPKYLSVKNACQMLSGKEVKFYSQANHMDALEKMYNTTKDDFNKHIKDYGYINNSYLIGDGS